MKYISIVLCKQGTIQNKGGMYVLLMRICPVHFSRRASAHTDDVIIDIDVAF